MTEVEFNRKLAELDRLINDPDVRLEPARVWKILAEVSQSFRPSAEVASAR